MPTTGECSLYFHVPFCTKKCPYCHFYVTPDRKSDHALLKEALLKHLAIPKWQSHPLASIYFGGGTPSLFPEAAEILAVLPKAEEITLEANPESVTLESLLHFRKAGFNRLSLGVQSLDDRALNTLERTHSAKMARDAILIAQKAGFANISIDLMYDLPDQTLASWQYTLDQIQDLPIQHLSLYNLTIEPHTAFHKRGVKTPQGEISLQFLQRALDTLEKAGLHRYEISAFAKPGFASKHNLGYWTGRPFLGFGPSAFSFWEGSRFRNLCSLSKYAKAIANNTNPEDFREQLPYPANLKEQLAVALRVREGVDLTKYPVDIPLEKLQQAGLIEQTGTRARLTEKGMLFYDSVAEEIIELQAL